MTETEYQNLKRGDLVYRVERQWNHETRRSSAYKVVSVCLQGQTSALRWRVEGRGTHSGRWLRNFWETSPRKAVLRFERRCRAEIRSAKRCIPQNERLLLVAARLRRGLR
jgi:hypothetical protein